MVFELLFLLGFPCLMNDLISCQLTTIIDLFLIRFLILCFLMTICSETGWLFGAGFLWMTGITIVRCRLNGLIFILIPVESFLKSIIRNWGSYVVTQVIECVPDSAFLLSYRFIVYFSSVAHRSWS